MSGVAWAATEAAAQNRAGKERVQALRAVFYRPRFGRSSGR
jgi:hypothetical protein